MPHPSPHTNRTRCVQPQVFKKTYDATFDERFVMAALAHDEELLVNLFDWDYIGQVQRCLLLSLFFSAPLSLLLASLPSVLLSVSSTHLDASCQSVQYLSMHPVPGIPGARTRAGRDGPAVTDPRPPPRRTS